MSNNEETYLRQGLVPQLDKLKAVSFAAAGTEGKPKPQEDDNKKNPKVKPMSKRVSTSISQCSSKMTEILSWQSKLAENKSGLNLGRLILESICLVYVAFTDSGTMSMYISCIPTGGLFLGLMSW